MRGKLVSSGQVSQAQRITPAGAGKTGLVDEDGRKTPDHPRRCGENGISVPSVKTITGSPPQVRGKQSDPQAIVQHLGITPAGAGKTDTKSISSSTAEDHPRRCGENANDSNEIGNGKGSPPQVRGKPAA